MELQQLRYFVAVIENKTMHAASRSLGLSQPALTRSIQDLERRMKVSLFERDARGVHPTDAGLDLLHHAKSVLRACADAKEDTIRVDRSRSGDVRFGVGGNFVSYLIPSAIRDVSERFPDLRLRVSEDHHESLVERLHQGKFDFVFGSFPGAKLRDGLIFEPLLNIQGNPYVRTEHPLARRRKVVLRDLLTEKWALIDQQHARVHLEQTFREQGLEPPSVFLRTNSVTFIKSLVRKADVITCMHDDFFATEVRNNQVVALRVPEFHYERKAGLFYSATAYRSAAVEQVMDTIRATCRAH
jgi:DNA-binding transcriptional LysR family regulator